MSIEGMHSEKSIIFVRRINQLLQDERFLQLQSSQSTSNLFEIVAASHLEMWHSAFIKWILDPHSSLQLGAYPIKRFLYTVIYEGTHFEGPSLDMDLAKIESNFFNLNLLEFENEFGVKPYGRIDIFGKNKDLRIIIENKINSQENYDQTLKYYSFSQETKEGNELDVLVYLSPDNQKPPKCKKFIQINYQQLSDYVLKPCLYHPNLTDENRYLIEEYLSNLASPIRGGNVLALQHKELCIQIYEEYEDVLNEIFLSVRGEVPRLIKKRGISKNFNMKLEDLVNSEILSLGDKFKNTYKGNTYETTIVQEDNTVQLLYEGKLYSSPSALSDFITQSNTNGWEFWKDVLDVNGDYKGNLKELRNEFITACDINQNE